MIKEIPLPDNHKRILSSSLYLVEKLLSEMEELILEQNDSCCSEIVKDIDERAIADNLSAIKKAKTHICSLVEKYNTLK